MDKREAIETCPNCGASFHDSEPRCPYCNAINPRGAEAVYMEQLEELKDDTDELDDAARNDLSANLKSNTKRVVRVVIIIVAAIVALSVIVTCSVRSDEQREIREYQARESFRDQYFPEFDRLYASGDDAALDTYVWSLMDDPGFEALFSWKHIGFLEAYDDWEALTSAESKIARGSADIDDYTWAATLAIGLAYPDVNARYHDTAPTQDEIARCAPYREHAREFLRNMLRMNDTELQAFVSGCTDEQRAIIQDDLKRSLTVRLQELGTI